MAEAMAGRREAPRTGVPPRRTRRWIASTGRSSSPTAGAWCTGVAASRPTSRSSRTSCPISRWRWSGTAPCSASRWSTCQRNALESRHVDSVARGGRRDLPPVPGFPESEREKIEEYLGDVRPDAMSDSLVDANSDFLRRGIRRELARRTCRGRRRRTGSRSRPTRSCTRPSSSVPRRRRTLEDLLAGWPRSGTRSSWSQLAAEDAARTQRRPVSELTSRRPALRGRKAACLPGETGRSFFAWRLPDRRSGRLDDAWWPRPPGRRRRSGPTGNDQGVAFLGQVSRTA
jgi:hypothetical protein